MDVPVLQYRYRRLALTAVSLELPCLLIYPLFYATSHTPGTSTYKFTRSAAGVVNEGRSTAVLY